LFFLIGIFALKPHDASAIETGQHPFAYVNRSEI